MFEELVQINIFIRGEKINSKYNVIFNKNPNILNNLFECTKFAPNDYSIYERLLLVFFNYTTIPICKTCKVNPVHFNVSKRIFRDFCCTVCSNSNTEKSSTVVKTKRKKYGEKLEIINEKTQNTNLERYGVITPLLNNEIKLKIKDTTMERYGVNHISKSEEIQNQKKLTNLEKYGVECTLSNPIIREKIKQTHLNKHGHITNLIDPNQIQHVKQLNMERHGAEHHMKTDKFKQKVKNTHIQKYGKHHKQRHISDENLAKLKDKNYLIEQHHVNKKSLSHIADDLGVNITLICSTMKQFDIEVKHHYQSKGERQISDWLISLGMNVKLRVKDVIKGELDIWLPDHNIAIEYCGLFWHSEQLGKDKWYHHKKWRQCNDLGIRLFTIFDDEWQNNSEIIRKLILNVLKIRDELKINARDCEVVGLSLDQQSKFLNQYHIQGSVLGGHNYGLLFNGQIVSVIVVKREKGIWYLSRYCTNCNVRGGFSKLMKYCVDIHNIESLTTFADLRYSVGALYEHMGFELIETIPPDYFYSLDGHNKLHKFNMRHQKIKEVLTNYDPELSERENCNNHNVLRIWDCGKLKYSWNKLI